MNNTNLHGEYRSPELTQCEIFNEGAVFASSNAYGTPPDLVSDQEDDFGVFEW